MVLLDAVAREDHRANPSGSDAKTTFPAGSVPATPSSYRPGTRG